MLFIMFYLKFYKFVFPDFLVSYRNMVALCLFFHFNWFVACFTCTSMNISFANCLLDFLTNSPYWTDVHFIHGFCLGFPVAWTCALMFYFTFVFGLLLYPDLSCHGISLWSVCGCSEFLLELIFFYLYFSINGCILKYDIGNIIQNVLKNDRTFSE